MLGTRYFRQRGHQTPGLEDTLRLGILARWAHLCELFLRRKVITHDNVRGAGESTIGE